MLKFLSLWEVSPGMSFVDNNAQTLALSRGEFLKFELGSLAEDHELDVYNPFPFLDEAQTMLFGRIESPVIETGTRPGLFSLQGDTWQLEGVINLDGTWQDLFHCGTFYDDADNPFQVFGGVHVYEDSHGEITGWDTELFRYYGSAMDLIDPDYRLEPFVVGPWKMKGIRPKQLDDGRTGVLARPQGDYGGLGSIGYFEIDNPVRDLQAALADFAHQQSDEALLQGICDPANQWAGPNQVLANTDGSLRVIGHRAWFDHDLLGDIDKKVYEGVVFDLDPATRETSDVVTVARADMFEPYVEPKKADMGPIIYPGGVVIDPVSGQENLFVGIGDRKSGRVAVNMSSMHVGLPDVR